jgi:diguanylate cyclase (GGDEF)-like protein
VRCLDSRTSAWGPHPFLSAGAAADVDPLTDGNRRMLAAAVMLDLDHFKAINDRLGHLAGDAVLAAIGRQLREVLRGADVKCRYGGEEFLVLLPDTPAPGAMRVAESLRQAFDEMTVRWKGAVVSVTASFGVTTLRPEERDPETLLARADAAFYRAKQAGRNCVRVAEDEPPAQADTNSRFARVMPTPASKPH